MEGLFQTFRKEEEERDEKQSIFLDELGGIGWHNKKRE